MRPLVRCAMGRSKSEVSNTKGGSSPLTEQPSAVGRLPAISDINVAISGSRLGRGDHIRLSFQSNREILEWLSRLDVSFAKCKYIIGYALGSDGIPFSGELLDHSSEHEARRHALTLSDNWAESMLKMKRPAL